MTTPPRKTSPEATVPADPNASSHSRISPPSASGDPTDPTERVVLDDQAIRRTLMRMAHEIVESPDGLDRLYLVAIPNGGVPLGRILVENLESLTGVHVPLGILDTTLYRDDLAIRGSRPQLRRTEMPSSVDDRVVVLVEDVVSTGRTIRAGMDALMDFGRPSHVRVVALIDRGHRELPIKIDYVGKNIPTQYDDKVILHVEVADADEAMIENEAGGEPQAKVGELRIVVRTGQAGRPPESPHREPAETREAGA